ncbi:MAG TPA: hypothetical protein VG348_01000, partial [Acidimicrobiia bacterium]|nr:hypothetical protein [Acidimicrobiia bacterium]
AMDAEDGNVSSNIQWTSSKNGALGVGASISKSNLAVGTHTITASVTDTGGKTASTSIAITINPLPPPTLPDPCSRCVPDPGPGGDGPPSRL